MYVSTVGGGAMTMVFRSDDPVKYPSVTKVKVPVREKAVPYLRRKRLSV